MKNIERLAKFVTKYGTEDIMIHTIYGTTNWLVCQKIEKDKWLLTLGNPMGNVTYNVGTVSDKQHLQLWIELTRKEVEGKTSQILLAKELKRVVKNFTAIRKFTKINEQKDKNKPAKQNDRRNARKNRSNGRSSGSRNR